MFLFATLSSEENCNFVFGGRPCHALGSISVVSNITTAHHFNLLATDSSININNQCHIFLPIRAEVLFVLTLTRNALI